MSKLKKFLIAGAIAVGLVAGAAVAANATGYSVTSAVRPDCDHPPTVWPLCARSVGNPQLVDKAVTENKLSAPVQTKLNAPDADALTKAYYSVAFYDKGDTNAGAIATVACKLATDTAISGGVQTLVDASSLARNTPVSSSFPGRMDWTTNTPKANRLDGWIVQFGGGAIAPEKVKVWALCVPGLSTAVTQTYLQSQDG